MDANDRPTILVVSDVRAYRDFLGRAVQQHPTRPQVATSPPGDHAIALLAANPPDVVVVDMRASASCTTISAIKTAAPAAKVIVFALSDSDSDHEMLWCVEAGVSGYVPLEAPPEDLAAALDAVLKNDLYVPGPVATALLRRMSEAGTALHRVAVELTTRERQVLTLLDRGLTNKEIASELRIEVATVKNHVHNVLTKMGVRSRAQAAARVPLTEHEPRHRPAGRKRA